MNSTFKLSLLAAVFAFAAPGVAMAASHTNHHSTHAAKHRTHHVKNGKARRGHSVYNQNKDHQDQATQDLNERSLQTVQSVNRDPNTGVLAPNRAGQPVAPVNQQGPNNTGTPMVRPALQQQPSVEPTMVPSTPATMGGQAMPSNAPGAVNPNNMPPAD